MAGPDSYRDLPRLIENAILSNSSSSRKEKKGERRIRDDKDGNTSPIAKTIRAKDYGDDERRVIDDGNVFGDFPDAKRSG